jgi:hypothetical protein
MTTLQDLLDELDKLDVEPTEVILTMREFRILLKRAEDTVNADSNDADDED